MNRGDIITFSEKPAAKKWIVIGQTINHEEGGLLITCKKYSKIGDKTSKYFFDKDISFYKVGRLTSEEKYLIADFDSRCGKFPLIKSLL